jgi:hypothetical protein
MNVSVKDIEKLVLKSPMKYVYDEMPPLGKSNFLQTCDNNRFHTQIQVDTYLSFIEGEFEKKGIKFLRKGYREGTLESYETKSRDLTKYEPDKEGTERKSLMTIEMLNCILNPVESKYWSVAVLQTLSRPITSVVAITSLGGLEMLREITGAHVRLIDRVKNLIKFVLLLTVIYVTLYYTSSDINSCLTSDDIAQYIEENNLANFTENFKFKELYHSFNNVTADAGNSYFTTLDPNASWVDLYWCCCSCHLVRSG